MGYGRIVEAAPRDLTAVPLMGGTPPGQPQVAQLYGVVDSDDPDTIIARLQPFAELAPLVQQSVQLTTYAAGAWRTPISARSTARGEPHSRSALIEHVTPEFAEAAVADAGSGALLLLPAARGRRRGRRRRRGRDGVRAPRRRTSRSSRWARTPTGSTRSGARSPRTPTGMYLSFDTSLRPERIAEAFPPATLERLRAIKARGRPDRRLPRQLRDRARGGRAA